MFVSHCRLPCPADRSRSCGLEHQNVETQPYARVTARYGRLDLLLRHSESAPLHFGRRRGPLEHLDCFQENGIVELAGAAKLNRKIEWLEDQDTDALDSTDRLDVVDRRFCLGQDVAEDRATELR